MFRFYNVPLLVKSTFWVVFIALLLPILLIKQKPSAPQMVRIAILLKLIDIINTS